MEMHLLPRPKNIQVGEESFLLSRHTAIVLCAPAEGMAMCAARILKESLKRSFCFETHIYRNLAPSSDTLRMVLNGEKHCHPQGYFLTVHPDGVIMESDTMEGLFYASVTLRQMIDLYGARLPAVEIEDWPDFVNRGYMIDTTRGRMPTLSTLKRLADRLAYFKVNQLQMYMEHTFLYRDQLSEVWSRTDPMAPETILEFDAYCRERNIELIPCMSTVSHMYDVLKSHTANQYCEMPGKGEPETWFNRLRYHVFDLSNPESFTFLTSLIDQYAPLFSADKINICCDEIFDLGTGRSTKKAEEMGGPIPMYIDFVNRLKRYIVEKHHKSVMLWADIPRGRPEYAHLFDSDITFINWWYYDTAPEAPVAKLEELGLRQYVCPSPCGFARFITAYHLGMKNITDMIGYGVRHHAAGFMSAEWGDDGHVNMDASAWPGMALGAAMSWDTNGDAKALFSDAGPLAYGDRDNRLLPVLEKIALNDKIIWNHFAFWADEYLRHVPAISAVREHVDKFSFDELGACVCESLSLLKRLDEVLPMIPETFREDVSGVITAAHASPLTQCLFQYVKKYWYKEEGCGQAALTPEALACAFELWEMDFVRAWRARDMETELHRIRGAIAGACDFLRRIDRGEFKA